MTRMKTLVIVGVMVLLILAATVSVFAASPWGQSADNSSDFNGICPRTGQSTEFCLGQAGGGRGQGNGLCNGTGNMMRQSQ